ncbi:MAG: PIN domain-containing protein [Spirochaetaceae bacterium]|nr:PIN domain-containing protein [Spirochaetaceae bacterium]
MVVLVDTNVILDDFLAREPFAGTAHKILELAAEKKITAYIASHSIPTIFYILRKNYSVAERKDILLNLCGVVDIAVIGKIEIIDTFKDAGFDDLEDCLQDKCACSINADYIITRNIEGHL